MEIPAVTCTYELEFILIHPNEVYNKVLCIYQEKKKVIGQDQSSSQTADKMFI